MVVGVMNQAVPGCGRKLRWSLCNWQQCKFTRAVVSFVSLCALPEWFLVYWFVAGLFSLGSKVCAMPMQHCTKLVYLINWSRNLNYATFSAGIDFGVGLLKARKGFQRVVLESEGACAMSPQSAVCL